MNSPFKRLWEIIPGTLSWSALILPIILSRFAPAVVVAFVILFDLYWLYKAIIMTFHLILGYRRHKIAMATNWLAKAKPQKGFNDLYHAVIVATYKEELPVLQTTFSGQDDN